MPTSTLEIGDRALDFTLQESASRSYSLKDFAGKRLVLYFYPKDDTSGCTTEAIEFTKLKTEFEALNAIVIGVSPDSCADHAKFKSKHDLTVMLLSDESKEMLQAYGVWVQKSMYGRSYMGVERTTFLIDEEGHIVQKWEKVKAPGHAREVLERVQQIS